MTYSDSPLVFRPNKTPQAQKLSIAARMMLRCPSMEMLIKIQLVLDRFKQVQWGSGRWFNQSIINMSEDAASSDYKLAFAIFNLNNFAFTAYD